MQHLTFSLSIPHRYDAVVLDQGSAKTIAPTSLSSRPPTPSPVVTPASLPMTPAPVTPPSDAISSPTDKPVAPPTPTTTPPPTMKPATSSPTMKPTVPIRKYEVTSTMVLYHSDLFRSEEPEKIWRKVTEKTIREGAASEIGIEPKLVKVKVELDDQNILLSNVGRSLRRLQDSVSSPLQIKYTTTMEFPSEEGNWDAEELVASGFQTPEQTDNYINDLQEEDRKEGSTYFRNVNSMTLAVNGATQIDLTEVDGEDTAEGDTGEEGDGGNDMLPYIIGGLVGGACFILFVVAVAYYATRMRRKGESKSSTPTKQEKSLEEDGVETEMKSEALQTHQPKSLCFGVIESREGADDDISTLGDPYLGDSPNPAIDSDKTVGESTMMSSEEQRYAYGVKRPQSIATGTVGGSTVFSGSNRIIFGDDTTLEDIYQTPFEDGTETNEDTSDFKRIKVVAPPGKLGIVLDNPRGDIPVVYAIKETSALNGKIRVGDLLLFVDEVDCRGYSAHRLSTLLNSRSQNPARTMILARGRTTPTVTVA